MKRYIEIFWCPILKNLDKHPWYEVACQEPKHLYPLLLDQRKDALYLKCPALSENFKNTFVVKAPFDLNFSFNNKTITTDRYGQDFYDDFILDRTHQTNQTNPILFSVNIQYLFFSHDSVEMEIKDVPILTSETTKNIRVIPGKFNISKWLRPTDFCIEVIDSTKLVTLQVGEPIFSVTFTTQNNVPVKLTRIGNAQDLYAKARAFTSLKSIKPNMSLNECYKTAESFIGVIKRWVIK